MLLACLLLQACKRLRLVRSAVEDCGGAGVSLAGAPHVHVEESRVLRCGAQGLALSQVRVRVREGGGMCGCGGM